MAIDGGYAIYGYVAGLSVTGFYLQRLNHLRRMSTRRGSSATANHFIDLYCAVMAWIAGILQWSLYGLAGYVAYQFGWVAGLSFAAAALLGMLVITPFITPLPAIDIVLHFVSIPATFFLYRTVLRMIGVVL